jgi:hypothetical protein
MQRRVTVLKASDDSQTVTITLEAEFEGRTKTEASWGHNYYVDKVFETVLLPKFHANDIKIK